MNISIKGLSFHFKGDYPFRQKFKIFQPKIKIFTVFAHD